MPDKRITLTDVEISLKLYACKTIVESMYKEQYDKQIEPYKLKLQNVMSTKNMTLIPALMDIIKTEPDDIEQLVYLAATADLIVASKDTIDIQRFDLIPDGAVFAKGITTNDTDGAYMTDCRKSDKLRWVAVKGYGRDWCIYCLWANESTFATVISNGDKINTREYILNLISCDDEVLKLYRK